MRKSLCLACLLLSVLPVLAGAEELVVAQKNKAFSASAVTIKTGDSISFRNDDAFVHNVFSLADEMSFDLGTYPQGQAKAVKFAKAGKFDIECAIHPEMKLLVTVH